MTRLLIVDDEAIVTDTISAYLATKLRDLEILTASSAFKAMDYLKKMPFDVVITDIRMPQMSGIELLQNIKRLWPACYVIVLTAFDEFRYAYETLKYDNVSFLLKIEEPETILETVKKAIKSSEDALIARQYEKRIQEFEECKPILRQSLLDRVFRYGGILPSQSECESINLPLEPGKDTLMAIAMFSERDTAQIALHRLQLGVEDLFEKKNITTASYLMPNRILFMFQDRTGGAEGRELRDYFFAQANQLVDAWETEGYTPSFACLDSPIPWNDIKTGFYVLEENCKKQRNDGSVIQISFQQKKKNGYPTVADLIQLKENLVFRDAEAFMQNLSGGIYGMPSAQRDMRASVMGVRTLFKESFDFLEEVLADDPRFEMLLDFGVFHDPQAWLEGIRQLLSRLIANEKTSEQSEESTVISTIIDYVEKHLSEPLTLTVIADALHYNSSYLSRLFKQSVGIGLIHYISGRRIERAAEKLAETDEKIDDIADACGFQSAKYFSIVFRNEKGCTPSVWRQNHRK